MRNRIQALAATLLVSLLAAGCASTAGPAVSAAPAPARDASADAGDDVATASGLVGTLDGAPYRIDMPADWNGTLIVLMHGYETVGTPRPAEIEPDAFATWAMSQRMAVARSAYASQGWAVAEALRDSEAVRQLAVESYGRPKRTLLVGHSLGGHIALATLEKHADAYDGALALCGVNAPAADVFADGVLAPLVAAEAWIRGVLGLAPGGLADPASPATLDPTRLETALAADEAAARRLADRFRMPREGLGAGLWLRYTALREMIGRAGGFPVDNRATRYTGMGDDPAFNASVRRYAGAPAALAYVAANAALAGTAPKPVVLMANVVDPFVPESISGRYAELAQAGGHAANVLTLPSVGEGHCAFDEPTTSAAFAVLARWVDTGVRPPVGVGQ